MNAQTKRNEKYEIWYEKEQNYAKHTTQSSTTLLNGLQERVHFYLNAEINVKGVQFM